MERPTFSEELWKKGNKDCFIFLVERIWVTVRQKKNICLGKRIFCTIYSAAFYLLFVRGMTVSEQIPFGTGPFSVFSIFYRFALCCIFSL